MAKKFASWPEGWPRSLNYPQIPVHALLEQTASRAPNRLAIIFGGMELTYRELKDLSDRFASALLDMGVQKGDRVAIHLIIYKGYNVYPREIEEVLFEHPAVQQCAVMGKPDPETGEYPVAFVQLKAGAEATEEDIMKHTNAQIAHYKKVRKVVLKASIPVSAAGKVLKKELRKELI